MKATKTDLLDTTSTGRPLPSVTVYDLAAKRYCETYESVTFEQVHHLILDLLPKLPAKVLDIGAGSGRDAAALAQKGHCVVAVEPSQEMRKEARRLHPEEAIEWIDDALPDLMVIRKRGKKYALILVSAVWMHVASKDRNIAFKSLAKCLEKDGLLVLTLRCGPQVPERYIFPVSKEEVYRLADQHGLELVREKDTADQFGRTDITWTTLVYRNPREEAGGVQLFVQAHTSLRPLTLPSPRKRGEGFIRCPSKSSG